jgi:hypothetical protein
VHEPTQDPPRPDPGRGRASAESSSGSKASGSAAPTGTKEQPAPTPAKTKVASTGTKEQPAPIPAKAPSTVATSMTPPAPAALIQPSSSPKLRRQASRRTRVVIRRVGPLSVLKFSLIFSFCAMLIVYFALLIIFLILKAAGAIDSLEKILGYVFGNGTSTRGPTPVQIDGAQLFTWLFFAGCVFAAAWSVISVFIALLYNLISDIVGGIEVTLAEKPPH